MPQQPREFGLTRSTADEVTDTDTTTDTRRARSAVNVVQVLFSLLALSALAVAQPLLDLIARNPSFLIAHEMTGVDVVLFAVAVTALVPVVAAAVVWLVGRINGGAAGVVAGVFVAGYAALLVLVALRFTGVAGRVPAVVSLGIATIAGAVAGVVWLRSAVARRAATVAVVAAPLTLVMFVMGPGAKGLVFAQPPPDAAAVTGLDGKSAPVVFLTFDEFPVTSLLGADRQIDGELFPNFARLAQDGTFFRNVSTVHRFTADAVPAIQSGSYTDIQGEALPTAADHPVNIFSLFDGAYELNVWEPLTHLCVSPECQSQPGDDGGVAWRSFLRDLAVIEMRLVLPPAMTKGLPSLDEGFRDFAAEAAARGKKDAFIEQVRAQKGDDIVTQFDEFVRRISAQDPPQLSFAHVVLPHQPWRRLPDGRLYTGTAPAPGRKTGKWANEWFAAQGYQRHLLQVQLADALLGRVLDRLEQIGQYDESAVVVIADHGISFIEGTTPRAVDATTYGSIGPVPFIMKPPGGGTGDVSDRPGETVDVLPTLLDVLGANTPQEMDGYSLIDPDTPVRTEKRFLAPGGDDTFPADGTEKWEVLNQKFEVFGRAGNSLDPFAAAPDGTRPLLGDPAPADAPPADGATATIADKKLYENIDVTAEALPIMITGKVRVDAPSATPPILAVSVNGRIEAVTQADPGRGRTQYRALVRPEALRPGANTIELFLVDEAGRMTTLPTA